MIAFVGYSESKYRLPSSLLHQSMDDGDVVVVDQAEDRDRRYQE